MEDIARASSRNTLIASECGIGKTVEAVGIVQARRAQGHVGPTLILCNNTAKPQWAEFIEEWDPGVEVVVTGKAGRWPSPGSDNSGVVDLQHYFHPRSDLYVIAHHEALSLPRQRAARKRRKYNAPKEWKKYVWENIIVDECHRYKSRKAMRWAALRGIDGLHRIGMTGTLIESNPSDTWTMCNWLYPAQFPRYWEFREEWCEQVKVWGGHTKVAGVKKGREKAFAELLAPFTIRRSKRDADVVPDLPPKIENTLPLKLEPGTAQYKLYAKVALSKDLEVRLPDEYTLGGDWHLLIPNTLSKIVRLQQILSDPRLLGLRAPSLKLEWVKDYVADNPTEPLVVFSKFRDVALQLAEDLDAAIAIGGKVERLADWQQGRVQVLCGTIAKMGESLNLQAASTSIFIDHEWSTIKMQQAYDRVDRIDITESKYIIHMVVNNTVDTLVQQALKDKWSDQELVWHYLKEVQDGATYDIP